MSGAASAETIAQRAREFARDGHQIARWKQRVDGQGDGSGADRGQDCHRKLEAVPEDDQHALLGSDAEAAQSPGGSDDHVEQDGVADR